MRIHTLHRKRVLPCCRTNLLIAVKTRKMYYYLCGSCFSTEIGRLRRSKKSMFPAASYFSMSIYMASAHEHPALVLASRVAESPTLNSNQSRPGSCTWLYGSLVDSARECAICVQTSCNISPPKYSLDPGTVRSVPSGGGIVMASTWHRQPAR